MRLFEFADAESQMDLWKLITDSVWQAIYKQAQEQKQLDAQKAKSMSAAPKSAKPFKPKIVSPPEFISSWGKHVDFIRFYFETCPYKRVTGLIWLGKLTFKALNTLASSGLMVPTPDMGSDPLMETR